MLGNISRTDENSNMKAHLLNIVIKRGKREARKPEMCKYEVVTTALYSGYSPWLSKDNKNGKVLRISKWQFYGSPFTREKLS